MPADLIHVRDPIHGSIRLTPAELSIVQSPTVQRLRGIRQLGFTDFAFPGATHTRFVHSLGAMEMATRMFESIFPLERAMLPTSDWQRFRQVLRLAVLLHDVGHAPLSHATEICMPSRADVLNGVLQVADASRATHEDFTLKLILDEGFASLVAQSFNNFQISARQIAQLLSNFLRPPGDDFIVAGINYLPLLRQLVSGELDADRMDYLQRDSYYTGVNYGKFDDQWLLNNLTLHLQNDSAYLAIGHRAIFAFEDFLLSRYHMFVSVYYHHASIGYDNMLLRYLEECPEDVRIPTSVHEYVEFDDVAFWSLLRRSKNRWAQRMVRRQVFRRFLETHVPAAPGAGPVDGGASTEYAALDVLLDEAGVEYFVSRDAGVLSRYYDSPATAVVPIFVINQALGQAQPVAQYSNLYQRYAQPVRLVRYYCHPEHFDLAQQCLLSYSER